MSDMSVRFSLRTVPAAALWFPRPFESLLDKDCNSDRTLQTTGAWKYVSTPGPKRLT